MVSHSAPLIVNELWGERFEPSVYLPAWVKASASVGKARKDKETV